MMRTTILGLALLASSTHTAAAGCVGADPAISSVKVQNVADNGTLKRYTLVGTVTNLGNKRQSSNLLQFVDIDDGKQRLDDRGVPPLAPGQSYTFSYLWSRSADAGAGTTTLTFRLREMQPGLSENCNSGNDTSRLTF